MTSPTPARSLPPSFAPRVRPVQGAATRKIVRDIRTLALFTGIYCLAKHPDRPRDRVPGRGVLTSYLSLMDNELCAECARTFLHGAAKRLLCPYDPKPGCKHCPTPCYAPGHREKVREIMRFSGLRLLRRGRLDLLCKYWL